MKKVKMLNVCYENMCGSFKYFVRKEEDILLNKDAIAYVKEHPPIKNYDEVTEIVEVCLVNGKEFEMYKKDLEKLLTIPE